MAWPLAFLYDPFMAGLERAYGHRWRAELLSGLEGRVLEIGAGTGANLAHYPEAVSSLVLDEPDPGMRRQLERKLHASPLARRAQVSDRPVEAISPSEGPFDAIVCTLVMCTVPDADRAARHLRELVAPGGKLVFLEHVAADEDPNARLWQDRLDPVWRHVAGGCRLNRRTSEVLEHAGFRLERLERETIPRAPRILRTLIRGIARVD
jgi:SAM-dependent methyltransferase